MTSEQPKEKPKFGHMNHSLEKGITGGMRPEQWYTVYLRNGSFIGKLADYLQKDGVLVFDEWIARVYEPGKGAVIKCAPTEKRTLESEVAGWDHLSEEEAGNIVALNGRLFKLLGQEVAVKGEYGVVRELLENSVVLNPYVMQRPTADGWGFVIEPRDLEVPYDQKSDTIYPLPEKSLDEILRMKTRDAKIAKMKAEMDERQTREAYASLQKTQNQEHKGNAQ